MKGICQHDYGKIIGVLYIPIFSEMSYKIRKYKLTKYLKELGFGPDNISEFVEQYRLNTKNHYSR